jgi:hypothetical protein
MRQFEKLLTAEEKAAEFGGENLKPPRTRRGHEGKAGCPAEV